ncbi:MAG TPA: hypothetical protein VGP22_00990, partial [Albitalea sp.]|nr:hypothetical protein [Albitalea sp.]
MNEPTDNGKIQGEGDYDAARRFDKAERDFVKSGKVNEGVRKAPPGNAEEAAEMKEAEEIGKSRSKGEAPNDDKDMQGNRSGDA